VSGLKSKLLRDLDPALLLAPIALALFGCIAIYSSAPGTGLWKKQLGYLFAGVVVAVLLALADYRRIILRLAPYLYGGALILLALVVFTRFGVALHGNRSWLHLPGLPAFQSSELAKLAAILMLARYASRANAEKLRLRDAALMALIVLAPVLLIKMEHDTGTMLTFGAILAAIYFMAGMRKLLMAGSIVALLVAMVVAFPRLEPTSKGA
jgi:rod shape determining protein RodA